MKGQERPLFPAVRTNRLRSLVGAGNYCDYDTDDSVKLFGNRHRDKALASPEAAILGGLCCRARTFGKPEAEP